MLGLCRYILAMMVACAHFWQELMWWQGIYAVFCFFLISGYLMSLVLNEVYRGNEGTLKYLANRALRIYPPYLVVLGLTVIAAHLFAGHLQTPYGFGYVFGNMLHIPSGAFQWFENITLIYGLTDTLAVSQAWSLRVELVFYVAMIFITRRVSLVLLWFALSVSYAVFQTGSGAEFWERYSTVPGSSIAFSLGALIYHLRKKYTIAAWHTPVAATAYILHLVFAPYLWGFPGDLATLTPAIWRQGLGLYPNIFLAAYLLYSLVSSRSASGRLSVAGDHLGKIAYSIFLLHWVVALPIIAAGIPFSDKLYFVPAAFVSLNIAAVLLYRLVEKPVNSRLRDKLRGR